MKLNNKEIATAYAVVKEEAATEAAEKALASLTKEEVKKELKIMFSSALAEAESMFLSEWCCSDKEEKAYAANEDSDRKRFQELLDLL